MRKSELLTAIELAGGAALSKKWKASSIVIGVFEVVSYLSTSIAPGAALGPYFVDNACARRNAIGHVNNYLS